ncbi:hypothetical protein TNCV_2781321 [Trichonephila clavipes]|nr:hypothetical protein TNCV_2781321 [Trichonephila clavipes]
MGNFRLQLRSTESRLISMEKWYWDRTRDQASHDPIPIPLGYRGHDNLIEEAVDLVRKINLEDSDDLQELLVFHNQALTIDELIEMYEQDIEELESLDPVQSEDRMTVGYFREGQFN